MAKWQILILTVEGQGYLGLIRSEAYIPYILIITPPPPPPRGISPFTENAPNNREMTSTCLRFNVTRE